MINFIMIGLIAAVIIGCLASAMVRTRKSLRLNIVVGTASALVAGLILTPFFTTVTAASTFMTSPTPVITQNPAVSMTPASNMTNTPLPAGTSTSIAAATNSSAATSIAAATNSSAATSIAATTDPSAATSIAATTDPSAATSIAATADPSAATSIVATIDPSAEALILAMTNAPTNISASRTKTAPFLIPATGADLVAEQKSVAHTWTLISLGFIGLGLVVIGFAIRRKSKRNSVDVPLSQ